MAIRIARARRRALSMTPLIDVIFLLLLFFMLSSTFSRFGEVELTGASQGGAVSAAPSFFLSVAAEDLRLNGTAIDLGDLPGAVTEENADGVLVSLAPQVTAQRLIDVLAVLRGIAGLQVTVLR